MGRQILSKREQAGWRGSLLIELLATMKKAAPGITEDWTRKVMVLLSHPQVSGTWARFITNHAHALRVEIRCRRGQFTPALVERLGMDVTIRHLRLDDQVQFWMQRMDQCDAQQLARLVKDSIVELSERTGAE